MPRPIDREASDAPRLVDTNRRGTPPPQLDPFLFPAYLLQFHPARLGVVGGVVIPVAGRVPLIGGCNGVMQRRDGAFSVRDAIRYSEETGWVVVPHDVDGPGTSYLRRVGDAWVSRWQTPISGSSEVVTDVPGYVAWVRSLLDRGVLPPLSRWALERLRERVARDLSEASDAARTVPSRVTDAERARSDLAAIDRELATESADLSALVAGVSAVPVVAP